jgi:adenine/guanine phosphoribosyltransferase-like PRPP-binding protein
VVLALTGELSVALASALAARAGVGLVFAAEADVNSPSGPEFKRVVYTDERSGAKRILEVRASLVPDGGSVLLAAAWVESGEVVGAAAKLVESCGATVRGVACVRFDQNASTKVSATTSLSNEVSTPTLRCRTCC